MASGEYSVWQFFPDGYHVPDVRFVDARTAVHRARALTLTVGARIGTTRRIIITDGGDFTVFEWKYGEGVTCPPPEDR